MKHWHPFDTILLERSERIARITLNRPERLNAMNQTMFAELAEATRLVGADPDVRVLIVTGAGRAFSAGRDVTELKEMAKAERFGIPESASHQTDVIRHLEIPVIAAVNGPAVGVGLGLALMADFRLAGERAKFLDGHVKMGMAASATCWYLPRVIGLAKALDVLIAGAVIEAPEAARLGLVSKVVSTDDLPGAALALAELLAEQPPLNTRLAKRTIWASLSSQLDPVLNWAGTLQQFARVATDEQGEAARKWLARRQAQPQKN